MNSALEHVHCPLCGADEGAPSMRLRDHHGTASFEAVRCGRCEFRYLDPAPRPGHLEAHYSENESGAAMRRPPGRLFRGMQRIGFGRETRLLRSRLRPGDAIVDLGAGDGALAGYFHNEGYRTGAADFYPESEWGRPEIPYRRLDLHGGTLTAHDVQVVLGGPPRAAVMRHVLEHLHRPRLVLEALAGAGTEWIYVVVPNCASPLARRFGEDWFYWDPPRHLLFFDQRSLTDLCTRSGFRVEASGHYGIDEIVTSTYRAMLLRDGLPGRGALAAITRPKGILAGISSACSAPWARTVCWCLARRRVE